MLKKNNKAIAPVIALAIIAGVTIVGAIGVYQVTQSPDVNYYVSDVGFSIAGADVSWFWIIGAICVVIIGFIVVKRYAKPPEK